MRIQQCFPSRSSPDWLQHSWLLMILEPSVAHPRRQAMWRVMGKVMVVQRQPVPVAQLVVLSVPSSSVDWRWPD